MNASQTPFQQPVSTVRSWLAAGAAALFCIVLGIASAHFVDPFVSLFRGLGVELPWPTRFVLATYTWLLPLLFIAQAGFVILKEFSVRVLRRKFLLTRRVFVAALVTAGLVIFTLCLPALTLAAKAVKAR